MKRSDRKSARKLTPGQLAKCFRSVKLLAIDVDGVLTDDCIYFGPDGLEFKKFNISDGFFMKLAMASGLNIAIVSGRQSSATDSRMSDLGVNHVLQGKVEKTKLITPLLDQLGITLGEVAFIGNEILDVSLARQVGLPIAVAGSNAELLKIARYVTRKPGGHGAVREVLESYFIGTGKRPEDYIPK
ncbi:MAG: HAD hydrolase family protein [candidate division Zixibacteria bacterium]|nr:HAD hydrolase family protein [candidate division Zixibacteria bacterium]